MKPGGIKWLRFFSQTLGLEIRSWGSTLYAYIRVRLQDASANGLGCVEAAPEVRSNQRRRHRSGSLAMCHMAR